MLKDFPINSEGNKVKRIFLKDTNGNINSNLKSEVYDFLGDDLMRKINYNLLDNQLEQKPKSKLRKI